MVVVGGGHPLCFAAAAGKGTLLDRVGGGHPLCFAAAAGNGTLLDGGGGGGGSVNFRFISAALQKCINKLILIHCQYVCKKKVF